MVKPLNLLYMNLIVFVPYALRINPASGLHGIFFVFKNNFFQGRRKYRALKDIQLH